MGRPTIIDVAKAAGVSKSTVSLVLQNSPAVSAKTREDVRKAMADLGYVYNRAAANLRSAQVGLVGLVINDLKNPFFTEFATAVQMTISAAGYATVVANTDEDPALQARTIAAMIEHGVSGLLISPAYGDEDATFGPLERAGIPAMQVLRKVSPRTDLFPFASPDYAAGGRLATEHLIADRRAAHRLRRRGGRARGDGRADVRLPRCSQGTRDGAAHHAWPSLARPSAGNARTGSSTTRPATRPSASTISSRSA